MPERTFGIQAVTIQPVPAIPWVKPGIITMAILAFTSLLITERKEYQQHYKIIIDDTLLLLITNFATVQHYKDISIYVCIDAIRGVHLKESNKTLLNKCLTYLIPTKPL